MSSQTKNLKSQIIKEKIKRLSVLFFSLLLTLAVFSQISAAKPKPTSDVGLDKGDWLYYKSNNDISAYLGKKSSSLPSVRYQKGNDYLEFSMTGVSSTTSVSLETDTKTPNTPTLFYRNAFNDTDIAYQITNIPFRVKEEIELKNPPAAPERSYGGRSSENLSFLFSAETSAKPVKQKDGSIAFFDNKGEYLFQLDKPFMVDGRGIISNDVSIEIKPTSDVGLRRTNKTKIASEETIFGDSNLEQKSGLPSIANQYNGAKSFVNNLKNNFINIKKVLDLRGIEPLESWIASQTPRQARPRTGLFYHKENFNQNRQAMSVLGPQQYTIILTASSEWLSQAAYPVIIDPTVTHNADANFTGQMNRIADSDTTTSTQLESSYPEATKDPYTVLLLHFNEANGTTAGIRDYASTTRVITANGNASTTSSVTQLGLGNSAAFDGTGDYLSIPGNNDFYFTNTGSLSIDFWVKLNATDRSHGMIGGTTWSGSADTDWMIDWLSSNQLRFQKYGSGPVASISQDTNWHHIAVTGIGGSFTLYFDGISVATSNISSAWGSQSTNLLIGTGGAHFDIVDSNYLNGSLDSLRILKGRALTPEEIKATASRRPYSVYTSPVVDATASVSWNTVNWTEGGVNTGNGEQPYNTNSLVAQWDFNDTSGTTLTASSSGSCTTACNGTLTNFAYTASQDQATTTTGWTANNKKWGAGGLMVGSAASADLVSITDPASNVLDPNSADLTIETWIKTSDTSAEIFSNNNANGTACANNGYYLGIDANGYPVFYLDTNGATAGCDASTTSQFKINDGNWHKVAVSVTRGTSAVIYVDGKSAGSDTSVTSYSAITVTGNAFWGGSAGGLDAILDSARFYSRALSASEILSNYNAGNIEIQTRTGATSDPNDGSWGEWKPTTGETQLLSMDSDAANWHSDIMASTTIATSTETVIKAEGTGSLKIRTGMASTTAGTVALWHFEETGTTTGTYLYDETANNNDATTTGTTVVDGIFGKARSFDGVDDNLTVPGSTNWNFGTGNFTIDLWGFVPSALSSYSGLVSMVPDSDTFFRIMANGHLQFRGQSISSQADGSTGGSDVRTGSWHHFAVVRTSVSTINVYVDGILDHSSSGFTSFDLTNTPRLFIGAHGNSTGWFNGKIDEPRIIKGRALSADEIAETYRMGANHHLTRQVSATDLSAQTKLAFNVASDRPGTYLEAMLGESDYVNYELASSTLALSTNTVLYIKGDEIASSTSIKDSSFSGKAITANGNARTAGGGKIGNSMYFDGTGDYLTIADSDDFTFGNGEFTIDFWTRRAATGAQTIFGQSNSGANYTPAAGYFTVDNTIQVYFYTGTTQYQITSTQTITDTTLWHHIAMGRSGNNGVLYIDGVQSGTVSLTGVTLNNSTTDFSIGKVTDGTTSVNGNIDEFRIIKGTALTPDQIRQAYEYGLRTHPITIDFGATLQTSDLISSATDYNFSLTATTSGLSATTSGLYLGDKIIIKENLGGTEYTAQGTVNAINTATGAITVPSWDTGSTFPASNGYSPNATVFKWQREYFDMTGAATTTRDAITNLTLRPTNGAEGRTIYLDDFRYSANYLTASSSSAITSSNNRYLQYRAIFTSTDTFVSPFLTAFNTLYTALANSFPAIIGVSGGGFLSF